MKRRFRFMRKEKPRGSNSKQTGDTPGDSDPRDRWENNWEKGEYPFVKLEANRASCAICLMDFDEPRRVGAESGEHNKSEGTEVKHVEGGTPKKLEEAGEEPQPLRLLTCSHAFHVSKKLYPPFIISNAPSILSANMYRPVADRRVWAVSGLPETCGNERRYS